MIKILHNLKNNLDDVIIFLLITIIILSFGCMFTLLLIDTITTYNIF